MYHTDQDGDNGVLKLDLINQTGKKEIHIELMERQFLRDFYLSGGYYFQKDAYGYGFRYHTFLEWPTDDMLGVTMIGDQRTMVRLQQNFDLLESYGIDLVVSNQLIRIGFSPTSILD